LTSSAAGYPAVDHGANPYQTGYANPATTPDAFAGNTALDLSHNPYASGDVQAGSFETPPGYMPDPNAPPQS